VLRALGEDYIVWDKAGEISFVSPGRGTVRAEFDLSDAVLAELRQRAEDERSVLHWFETDVRSASGELIAKVRKQIYVRRKRPDLRAAETTCKFRGAGNGIHRVLTSTCCYPARVSR